MKGILIAGILSLFIVSCSKKQEDQSLTREEYIGLGMPNVNRVWRSDDYLKCASVLRELKHQNFYSLPRLNSERSKYCFSRIIARDNIDTLLLDRHQGKVKLRQFADSFEEVLFLYLEEDKDNFYHEEIVELLMFLVTMSDKTFVNFASLPNVDSASIHSLPEYIQMENGYRTMILAALEYQNDGFGMSETDLDKFSSVVANSLEMNLQRTNDSIKNEIMNKVKAVVAGTKSSSIKKNYNKILEIH